ncbi:diaminohydroxyphosphoribosylaminopyrimidine deaminase / 5-amino-6-(5-phosphoribosylamino)uracil reductase [Lachnospiraceae bacterium A10]|nr:diaminohydroxyphosphoribosylaminopyrimidine deaminase / 5-amino-6-(5-phosphoribosylamino)uracil reductase [Lachnospiraceae bacterium A10]
MTNLEDEKYMRRAIELAKLGEGYVHPNPLVGAVIVKDGRIVGSGYHRKYGCKHAEREAFASLQNKEDAVGATLYVTLEPCCHRGKTPPCTEAILEHKIARVVIGSRDPNPLVSGRGVRILQSYGVEVVEDFLKEECDALNPIFFHYITKKTPYVFLKYAQTLDGKIATKTGKSKWISCEKSREDVHFLRHRCMGILVGIQTVLSDDPSLTARYREHPRNPIRIVLDAKLRIPLDATLVKTAGEVPTIVVTSEEFLDADSLREKRLALENAGVEILGVPKNPDTKHLSLTALMQELGKREIDSVLIEGGGCVNDSAIREDLVDEIQIYLAPKVFGGAAPSPVGGIGVSEVMDAKQYHFQSIERIGEDLKLCYRRAEGCLQES